MTTKKAYLLLQAVLCVLLTVILIATVIGIYHEGLERRAEHPLEWIYTREIVAEKFAPVAPLFFISVGMGLAGIFLDIRDDKAGKAVKDAELTRNLTVARVAEPSEAMKKERAQQKKLLTGGWIAFALCTVPMILYLADGGHFPNGDLEPMIAALAAHVLPWMALAVGCLVVSSVLQERSMLRETEAAQERIREEQAAGIKPEPKKKAAPKKTGVLQAVLIIAAIAMIIAGAMNGSARDVLYKAAKICTECVGLG